MSAVGRSGTIEALDSDGLGWIALDGGGRLRFGASACGFAPRVGQRVTVLEQKGGLLRSKRATKLRLDSAEAAEPPAARPSSIDAIEALGVTIDEDLRRVLARCDEDDQLFSDFATVLFDVEPFPATEIDCHNPWLLVIAMNGGGSAYGLYLHPDAGTEAGAPWVFWEHEDGTVYSLAASTREFFERLLSSADFLDDQAPVERLRGALLELGLTCNERAPRFDTDQLAPWLPPANADLLSLDDYVTLASDDPAQAEQGLLGHLGAENEPEALEILEALYRQRGWSLPFQA
ncbi:MAG: SMI1/KNR4 family protein [Polyangiaceae bacterium]|nr:SMI1/KNR4 family protein [Polyangiaceae bacterium]MCB9608709.1 SMI1/KNR4 family protein [Polyangiaceae bacterium]